MTKMDQSFENLQIKFPEKKKFRIFFLFVFLSFIFWVITKLSNTYNSEILFKVTLTEIPDLILPKPAQELSFTADVSASGFQLLLYHFVNNEINISIQNGDYSSELAQVDLFDQRFMIQQQLYQSSIVNQFQPDILSFAYDQLKRKKVPVLPMMEIDFKPGYERVEDWTITPDSIWVVGPTDLINPLNFYPTKFVQKQNVAKNISENIGLEIIQQLKPETNKVRIEAQVNKFTEKTLDVFVNIKNLPDSLTIKLFPQSVKTTFLVLMDRAQGIRSSDFFFHCDFNDTKDNATSSLDVKLDRKPDGVRNIRWEPIEVDYLIRQ